MQCKPDFAMLILQQNHLASDVLNEVYGKDDSVLTLAIKHCIDNSLFTELINHSLLTRDTIDRKTIDPEVGRHQTLLMMLIRRQLYSLIAILYPKLSTNHVTKNMLILRLTLLTT